MGVWLVVSVTLLATKQVTATELLRCAERGTVLLAGECHLPLSQGPCPIGHTILASEDGTGFCSPWKCKEDEVSIYFTKLYIYLDFRYFGVMEPWKSALNLSLLFAQDKERGCGQSLMGVGSAVVEMVGGDVFGGFEER